MCLVFPRPHFFYDCYSYREVSVMTNWEEAALTRSDLPLSPMKAGGLC